MATVAVMSVLGLCCTGFAKNTWISCTVDSVAVFASRIHVKCAEGHSGIYYFAYPTTDDADANRFLGTLNTAYTLGTTLSILYDPADTSGTSYGCLAADCRPFKALAFN